MDGLSLVFWSGLLFGLWDLGLGSWDLGFI